MNKTENQEFQRRLQAHHDELRWLYMELYNNGSMFFELMECLEKFYAERSQTLKAIDRKREADPNWYRRNDLVGMMLYIDNFGGTIRGVQEKLRSFDPNLRPPLWRTLDEAKEQVLYGMAHCDILKISDNEIQWLTQQEDFDAGVRWIRQRFPNIRLLLLSMGKDGSRGYSGDAMAEVKGFSVPTIETTGAGDTFFGGILHHVLAWGLRDYTRQELEEMLTFANAAAALVTTRKGALRVMPSLAEIQALRNA